MITILRGQEVSVAIIVIWLGYTYETSAQNMCCQQITKHRSSLFPNLLLWRCGNLEMALPFILSKEDFSFVAVDWLQSSTMGLVFIKKLRLLFEAVFESKYRLHSYTAFSHETLSGETDTFLINLAGSSYLYYCFDTHNENR